MKTTFLLFFMAITLVGVTAQTGLNVQSSDNPVVMEINGKPIFKSEFLQIYLKNNPSPKFDKNSIDEYVELYKKFKLKVTEAEYLKYDTISRLKKELEGYRKTLSTPYLVDKSENQKLVEEAYQRLKKEVRASHILITVDENAKPEDTLRAYNKISVLKKRIEAGEDFNSVAKSNSEDPSAVSNAGDLGYFTAFQMVFPFEEAAYTSPINKVSSIIRTKFGYHILKVTDVRDARGIMKAAHIMVSVKRDANESEITDGQRKIDEIYEKAMKGENFDELALNFSDDPGSSEKGGKLPEFGSGTQTRMVPEFEEAAFKLTTDGEISEPIQTNYGFHIIKRLSLSALPSMESMKKELQNKVNRDDRGKKTQNVLIAKLKVQYNFQEKSKTGLKWFNKHIDSNYFKGTWTAKDLKTEEVLFTLNSINYTQKMFANYLEKNYRNIQKQDSKTLIQKQYNQWVNTEVITYENTQLETKYPEFKALMQEYHDGVLLYEIMTDKVWNKASTDTLGLNKFYEQNLKKFMWKDRIDATVYECLDKKIATQVHKMLKNDTINSKHVLAKINEKSELNLKVRMNKFEITETPFLKDHNFKKGLNAPYEFSGKYYVIKATEILPSSPKKLTEAKGIITSEYQNEIERNWMEELNNKYSFKLNENIIYNLNSNK